MTKHIAPNNIDTKGKTLKAVQCLWNSDLFFLSLSVELIYKDHNGYSKCEIVELDYKDFKSYKALSKEGERIAKNYAKKHHIEFYFPSPDEWSRNCPDWWNAEDAFKCEDCQTPIIPTESEYLPKEICSPCHLTREQNNRIRNAEPRKESVYLYLNKKHEFKRISHCQNFESLTIAPFLTHKDIKSKLNDAINTRTIKEKEIRQLIQKLESQINHNLLDYIKPTTENKMSKLGVIRDIEYKGITYGFKMDNFNTLNLIKSYNTAISAINEGFEYIIYFKQGINHRDDDILRFINYTNNGGVKTKILIEKYRSILSKDELESTIQKLIKKGCLSLNKTDLLITETGKYIV